MMHGLRRRYEDVIDEGNVVNGLYSVAYSIPQTIAQSWSTVIRMRCAVMDHLIHKLDSVREEQSHTSEYG